MSDKPKDENEMALLGFQVIMIVFLSLAVVVVAAWKGLLSVGLL